MTNPQIETGGAVLRQAHSAWRNELREVLAPVRKPEAGVWERWRTARYLVGEFAPRLAGEMQVLTTLLERVPQEQRARAWALGELLQLLCRHLCELSPVPQTGPAFAYGVEKVIRAFDVWCAEVEAAAEARPGDRDDPETVSELDSVLDRDRRAVPACVEAW